MNVGANRQLSGEYGGRYITSATGAVYGNFTKIHAVSASTITITSSNITDASSVTLAQGQEFNGRVSALSVSSGAIIAYNARSTSNSFYATTNKASFVSTDYLDWSVFGASGTIVPVASVGASNLGNNCTVSTLYYNSLYRMTQGVNWTGNFTNGDALIYSWGSTEINLSFARLVGSAGCQIQSGTLGTYYARMEAYDSFGSIVGVCTGSGISTTAGDGSALFLGCVNSTQCIKRIDMFLLSPTPKLGKFSVNRVLLA